MQFLFECKVDEMEQEVNELSDLIRDELKRVDERFAIQEMLIGKIKTETQDKLFNMKTQQIVLKQSTMSLVKGFSSPRKKTYDSSDELMDETDSLKSSTDSLDRQKRSSKSDSEDLDQISPGELKMISRPSTMSC